MKEYIDKERFREVVHRNIAGGDSFDQLIDIQPTADVVEKEKLKKAREEIQKLRGCSCGCSDGIIDDVEDILDKLIESEKSE